MEISKSEDLWNFEQFSYFEPFGLNNILFKYYTFT